MTLVLRPLTDTDGPAFFAGMHEARDEEPDWYTFVWQSGMSFKEMLVILRNETAGRELAAGTVPHSMLYAFVGGEIVGRLSVRHKLNDQLRKFGGHMGYWVAKKHRRKGYASEIVRQGLEYCRSLRLEKIMVTCADDNVGSCKIIENFGGELEDKIQDDTQQRITRRYWINIS